MARPPYVGRILYLVRTKDVLWKSIINVRENTELKKEVEELREQIEDNYLFDNSIIGQSKAIKTVFKHLEKAIKSNINISITCNRFVKRITC